MFIDRIIDYDEFSGEASLIVSDGTNELLCYCCLFDKKNGIIEITTFLCDNIIRIDFPTCNYKKQTSSYYSYVLQGKVIDIEQRIVSVGNILIRLDSEIPKDIHAGEYVSFNVMRLDCSIL